jgi:hypothetical protein
MMKLPRGSMPVSPLIICGNLVPVFLVPDLMDGPNECDGYYETASPSIFIHRDIGAEYSRQVLVHEVCHAMLHLSGAMYELEQDLREGVDAFRVEERLVRTLTPHIVAMMGTKRKAAK